MTDTIRSARDDLAYMKAVVDDRGPLPGIMGAHLLAVGLIYGPTLAYVWAIYAGLAPWPADLMWGTWLPGTIVHLPVMAWLFWRGRDVAVGPGARAFGSAWATMGLMTAATVAVLSAAQIATGEVFVRLWPAMAFVLYGGAWAVAALIRRNAWHGLVAAASFALAVTCGALVGRPEVYLMMGAGIVLVFALPGLAILRLARRPA